MMVLRRDFRRILNPGVPTNKAVGDRIGQYGRFARNWKIILRGIPTLEKAASLKLIRLSNGAVRWECARWKPYEFYHLRQTVVWRLSLGSRSRPVSPMLRLLSSRCSTPVIFKLQTHKMNPLGAPFLFLVMTLLACGSPGSAADNSSLISEGETRTPLEFAALGEVCVLLV